MSFRLMWKFNLVFLVFLFGGDGVCLPLLSNCRPFCNFERCLDSNPKSCCSKQARYQLSRPPQFFKMEFGRRGFPSMKRISTMTTLLPVVGTVAIPCQRT